MQKIQMEEAQELRNEWGNKPCHHNAPLAKEYYLATDTGDLVCSQCGFTASREYWERQDRI
ncbi:hypothetical protein D3C85_1875270 [compost metagenome]